MKTNQTHFFPLLSIPALALIAAGSPAMAAPRTPSSGMLLMMNREGQPTGECPLKRTEVKAEITGFLSRVTVTQNFENPANDTIEAVYTFPLPAEGAVDRMTMLIGDRTVEAKIKPREEARAIFDAARQAGKTASMLEQERPNIFTQSVTNIRPGDKVRIVISYVAPMKYEAGTYEFVFPMVVGPRYIPGNRATGRQAGGWAPDTDRVPDASRITPNVAIPGTRAGHDITVDVALDAGVPIQKLECSSHEVVSNQPDPRHATVRLKDAAVIPNKDFILRYRAAGDRIEDAVLAHRAGNGGFFTLILQPPDRVPATQITPKELVFVLDTSGSMHGFPLDKSKEVMRMALSNMNPEDRFNIITFAGDTHLLFNEPVAATRENIEKARGFIEGHRGGGGTEMMKAIRAALDPTDSLKHLRVVAFLTDGYVGNDFEIIGEVKKHPNARVFSFGIGSAVNRYLLDKIAEEGRGEAEFVTLNDDGSAAAKRFFERVRNPLLTDVKLDFGGLGVTDVYPARIPDLFAARPLVIHGRYNSPGKGAVRITGKIAGQPYARTVACDLPASESRHDVLASLWARSKVEDLMAQDYQGMQQGTVAAKLQAEITKISLEFRIITQFTAFVAVEERVVNEGGKVRRVEVMVEMPEGVSHEGVFGDSRQMMAVAAPQAMVAGGVATRGKAFEVRGIFRSAERAASAPPIGPSQAPKTVAEPRAVVDPMLKIHPGLQQAVLAKSTEKVRVKIYLTSNDAAVAEELKRLGLEAATHDAAGMFVTGRISAAALAQLASVSGVRYISPD